MEALRPSHAGHSIRRQAKSMGLEPVRQQALDARAQTAAVVSGDRPRSGAEWDEMVVGLFPERQLESRGDPHHGVGVPSRDRGGVETNTVTNACQRLRYERGLALSMGNFRGYVRQGIRAVRPREVTVPKDPTLPGQVAFATGPRPDPSGQPTR